MPKGLAASRWASDMPYMTSWPRPAPTPTHLPSIHAEQSNDSPFPSSRRVANNNSSTISNSRNGKPSSPEQQLSRFLKIVARLKWKIPFLEMGYGAALERVGKQQQEIDANEIHFKLDFHEFYMLIERALVHLMGVYGIAIRGGPNNNKNSSVVTTTPANDHSSSSSSSTHQYHENVLLALDDVGNPLHKILGRPEVRKQFSRAKDLRNRWKHADEDVELYAGAACSGLRRSRFMPAPLEAYQLKEILQTILMALDEAYLATEEFVRRRDQTPGTDTADRDQPVSMADWTTDSDDWEFMVDAMDWEVV